MTGITRILDGDEPCVAISDDGGVLLGVNVSSAIKFRTVDAYEAWVEGMDRSFALARAEWVRTRFPSLLARPHA